MRLSAAAERRWTERSQDIVEFIYWIKVSFVDVIMANAKDKLEIYCYWSRGGRDARADGQADGSADRQEGIRNKEAEQG